MTPDKLPAVVRVDNLGTKCMAGNITATSHSKHMDINHKFIIEYVENGVVKIVF